MKLYSNGNNINIQDILDKLEWLSM
jgi:hypothetical protein